MAKRRRATPPPHTRRRREKHSHRGGDLSVAVDSTAVVDRAGGRSAKNYPCIGFFPALPLGRNLDLGDWIVGPRPPDTPWRSVRFKGLVETLLASFASNEFGDRFL